MPLEIHHDSIPEAIKEAQSYDFEHAGFDPDEISYLNQWLCRNIGLDKGLRGPKKIAEQRFLSMLRSTEPINIKGVETYIKPTFPR